MPGKYKGGDTIMLTTATGDRQPLLISGGVVVEDTPGNYWVATELGVLMHVTEGQLAPRQQAQGQAAPVDAVVGQQIIGNSLTSPIGQDPLVPI